MPEDALPARPPVQRASHQDRDKVVEELRAAAGDGKLTMDELDERLELALGARTLAELVPLTADLGSLAATAVKQSSEISVTSGKAERFGAWQVPRNLSVDVTSGQVTLNLTEAQISASTLDLDVKIGSGRLTLVVPPGVSVDADAVTIRSGSIDQKHRKVADAPVRLRIAVTGSVRSGSLKVRPPRRTFFGWLTHQPHPDKGR